jgi:DNA polymerase-3 subunit gamma/tau
MVDALAAGDRAAVFETVDRLVEAGHDPRRFAADLLQRLRDLVLLQSVPEAAERGLVEAADDEIARMAEQAGKIGAATLTRYGEIVHTGLTEMRGATAPRLLLELLCARMLLPAATVGEPGLLERLERLERRNDIASAPPGQEDAAADARRTFRRPSVASGTDAGPGPAVEPASPAPAPPPARQEEEPARPAAAPAAPTSPARPAARRQSPPERTAPPVPPPPVAPSAAPEPAPPAEPAPAGQGGALDAAAVRRVWSEVLAAARSQSRSIEAMLVNATVRAVQGDTLVLGIGAPSLARRLSEPRNSDIIAAALNSVLGVRWQVRCESGDTPAAPASAPARGAAPRRSEPPSRPQQAPPAARAQRPPPVRRSSASDDGVPLPPEPPDEDVPPEDDEEAMLAEAAVPVSDAERRDPEEAAIELLTTQLGARAIDRP